ncbi:bacterio-opsin activator domain-containing protein [Natronobacterium lacisalsi]|uniref:bacterio-opsin activator domain-containing protein n=1 Tax=Natronobacterium lacisalsi TaxID=229731 RepID=UPI001EE71567|nr:bacterio-opsin activator domain-containing protein [Halobiforma lacisalsi]
MGDGAGAIRERERVSTASTDAIAIVDGERHGAVNAAYADLYGFSRPDDLVGEPWDRRLAEDERSRLEREILPSCRSEGYWRGTITGRRRDGTTVSHELSIARLTDDQYVCTAREAAGEERTGRDAREHTRLLERAFDAVEDIVYVFDEDGDAVLWNATLREVTGYTDSEIAGLEPAELIAPEERERGSDSGSGSDAGGCLDQLGDRQVDLVTKDGERVPHEFRGTTFEDRETGRIYRCGVARDVTDRTERERQLRTTRRFNEELVENAPFGMFRLDDELRITYENQRAEEIIGLPENEQESEAIGTDIRDLPSIAETGQADLFTRLKDGETIEFEFPFESIYGKEAYFTGRGVPLYRDDEFEGAILMAIDISERRRRERQLERQRDELETLNRINELLLEITRDLFASPTRTEIEQTVCDRLATSDLYQFAWIGAPETGGQRIVPRANAGIDEGYVETVTVTTAGEETGQGPAGRAFRSGEVQVSQNIRTDPTFEPWRDAALERGVESAAAVPLVHGDRTYGILAVYATRPLAFSRREQSGFEVLGEAVGFAINAIEEHALLFADTIVELEFEVTDSGLVFVRASDRLACEIDITGYVESASGTWSVYLTVDGAEPAAVREVATADPDVERARVVADEGETGLLEFAMNGPAVTELAEHGAMLTSGYADDGRGRFCIEAPQTTDIRQLSDRLQTAYPKSTLVAQREFDRPVQKPIEIRQSIADRLTDRQQEALQRAYHAGYFEWPRRSTAGDIADSMDISETTFHYHLRNALETLATAFVGELH